MDVEYILLTMPGTEGTGSTREHLGAAQRATGEVSHHTMDELQVPTRAQQQRRGLWSHATSGDGVHHPTERYC